MINIIKKHYAIYPKMEIRDMFKLIYQSEFGGGHMIKDKNISLEWIKKEYEELSRRECFRSGEICEDIGDDMCRIYLSGIKEGLAPETLNEMFVISANTKKGSITGLEKKLEILTELCECEEIGFECAKVREEIKIWKEQGYPAMHHSSVFRENYFPAYRVVLKKFAERWKVFCDIDRSLREDENKRPYVVAIDGMAGAGKSMLGGVLSEVYSCNLFHMDDYFLRPEQRTAERFAEPGGNVDYERFKSEVWDQLENVEGLTYQPFDCSVQNLADPIRVPYSRLVIIEGAYALHPYFEDQADLKYFAEISPELQRERIRKRNGEWMLKRFVEEWIPLEHKYFEAFKIKEKAKLIG